MTPLARKLLIFLGIAIIVICAFVGWVWYGTHSDLPIQATMGPDPQLVDASPERIPTFGLARTVGWKPGEKPVAAPGLAVNRFADGLDHPRTMLTLPNGDVLVAETNAPASHGGGIGGFFRRLAMNWVGAGEPSPDTIVLLRDGNDDGKAEQRFIFRRKDMHSPSGMAYGDGKLYIANDDAVLAFDFTPGATTLTSQPRKIMDLPPDGEHWMRNLLLSPDGKLLYVAVGSATNLGDNGMDAEQGRAGIWEIDLKTGSHREYGGGMRNPNGMAWNPSTGELWTVVQERDMLGPDLVPDYLSNVPVGVQYGWPWVYWKDVIDWRVDAPMPEYMTEYTRKPEYALGAHTSVLGLLFSTGGNLMGEGFENGAFIARHGSWNRKPLVGYDVIFVPFDKNGNPAGKAKTVLSGFLTGHGHDTHGRPVWLQWSKQGALLVSDDTGGVIWRVLKPGATPSPAPKPVVLTQHMPPVRALNGNASLGQGENIMEAKRPD
jgi:glucose/arabinose dehydrogenase